MHFRKLLQWHIGETYGLVRSAADAIKVCQQFIGKLPLAASLHIGGQGLPYLIKPYQFAPQFAQRLAVCTTGSLWWRAATALR